MNNLIFKIVTIIFFLGLNPFSGICQGNVPAEKIMFYNVENLFDTDDDSLKSDEEFLPEGVRYWNNNRLFNKLTHISQVIMAASKGTFPSVIGLCEVENSKVLDLLLFKTPLGNLGYKYVHKESPDKRGIDVAFLYKKDRFAPLSYFAIPIVDPNDSAFKTRDILYVKGILSSDTIHFFVNHWPSKYGGTLETKSLRALAAKTLRTYTDSILSTNNQSKIIIMGDFNDSPIDESIKDVLEAKKAEQDIDNESLYNLGIQAYEKGVGSNKYQEKWELIDQFIVSGNLLKGKGLTTSTSQFSVFKAPFLVEKDENHLGEKTNRTYIGFKYHGGFSDHLPILLDLQLRTD